VNSAPQPRLQTAHWVVLGLLILSIFLNYIDRSNLSVAAPLLEAELSLSPARLGLLFSAFFWTYALLQLFGLAGWAADRFSPSLVLAAALLLWSASTVASGLVSGFVPLFLTRLLLGAGESFAYPCYSRLLTQHFPETHRGLANALLDAGSKLGPALGTLLGGLLLARLGWRPFFVLLGAASLLWLLPWLRFAPRSAARAEAQAGPSVARLLATRSAWGAFLGHFCGNYYWFFLITWLPTYLVRERHLTLPEMARISSLAFLLIAAATTAAGALSDRLIRRGLSVSRVRKSVVCLGLAGSTALLPVAFVDSRPLAVALLFAACLSFGVYTSNHWAITQTLAGPAAAGRWTSLQNGIGNLSGIVASWLTGAVVQLAGSFPLAFVTSALFALLGALCWGLVVGPVREIDWSSEPRP